MIKRRLITQRPSYQFQSLKQCCLVPIDSCLAVCCRWLTDKRWGFWIGSRGCDQWVWVEFLWNLPVCLVFITYYCPCLFFFFFFTVLFLWIIRPSESVWWFSFAAGVRQSCCLTVLCIFSLLETLYNYFHNVEYKIIILNPSYNFIDFNLVSKQFKFKFHRECI